MNLLPVVVGFGAAFGLFGCRYFARRARRRRASRAVLAHLPHASLGRGASIRTVRDHWRYPPTWFVVRVRELQLPVASEDVWRYWKAAAVAAGCVGFAVGGPFLAAIAVGVVAVAPPVAAAVLRSRADARYDNELASFLDEVARGVRSGGSLPVALGEASLTVRGVVAADTQRVAASVARGQPIGAALDRWSRQRPRGAVHLAVGALALAVETGGPPARVIEEVAAALRQRQQVEGEAHALAAQARLSAVVVGLAPVGFALLTSITDRRNAHLLFGTPIGIACVIVGLTLDAAGALWMHRISASVTR